MKRIYRVAVVIESAFERKATRTAKDARKALLSGVPDGWSIREAAITSVAKPATPPPRKPTERESRISAQLEVLRGILADMATILGNVKRPRLHLSPNRWCDDRPPGAHAHSRGRNRGLICIAPKEVLRTIGSPLSRTYTVTMGDGSKKTFDTNPPRTSPRWLMAHELMHIRMPGGSHGRAAFKNGVSALMGKYDAFKAGTWKPPERVLPWTSKEEAAPPEQQDDGRGEEGDRGELQDGDGPEERDRREEEAPHGVEAQAGDAGDLVADP